MQQKSSCRALSLLLAFLMLMTLIPAPVQAATTYTLTILDQNGTAVDLSASDITVKVNNVTQTLTKTGTGVFQYSLSRRTAATVTINAEGFDPYSGSIARNSTNVTIRLTGEVDEYVTFQMFYYIGTEANTFPANGYAAAGSPENYGPSGNDTPFAEIQVNITQLKKHTDAVQYVTGQNGNNWHFVPLLENDLDSAKAFWNAVLQCVPEESMEVLNATGLAKEFVGYCLKDQGSYHLDGILAENPPVYVVELHSGGYFSGSSYIGGTYMGGTITGKDTPFATMAQELDLLEGYLAQNITWHEDASGNPIPTTDSYGRLTYTGTYITQSGNRTEVHNITVTQLNYANAKAVEGTDILYEDVGEYYHLAQFAITTEMEYAVVSYTVTYTDGAANEEVFYDHQYGANRGDPLPQFPSTPVREGYRFQGWVLEQNNTLYTLEQLATMTVSSDMTFHAAWLAIPKYNGTVEVILDGSYDSTTGIATGTRVDITEVTAPYIQLFVHPDGSDTHIPLERTASGVYTAQLEAGNYRICYYDSSSDTYYHSGDQFLTIENQDRTRYLFFTSVTYDANGGVNAPDREIYANGSAVSVSATAPTREGYLFTGWLCEGTLYQPGQTLLDAIYLPRTLVAQWVRAQDVYVTIRIEHTSFVGAVNNDRVKHNIAFTLDSRQAGSTDNYTEIFTHDMTWGADDTQYRGTHFYGDFYAESDCEYTLYTPQQPTLQNVSSNLEYTFTTNKPGYALKAVTTEKDANGDLHLTAVLVFTPDMADLRYQVRLDEKANALPQSYKPAAVNVKVLCWYDTPFDEDYNQQPDDESVNWYTIAEQRYTYERVALDPATGIGMGFFHVPKQTTDGLFTYHYRIEVVSYELSDGTILPASDLNGDHYTYTSQGNRYFATVTAEGGATPTGSDLPGVYFNNNTQIGTLEAVVSIPVYTVTYLPNGGLLNGSADATVVPDLLLVPAENAYVPTRDGAYVFDGWYLPDGSPAPYGTDLVADITLTAKWREPLTIRGLVTAAGSYEQHNADGSITIHHIPDSSRVTTAMVLLQKIDPNGYTATLQEMPVTLEYGKEAYWFTDEVGTRQVGQGSYVFEQIPDDGTPYRIQLLIPNYTSTFQNEPDSLVSPLDYPSYTVDAYTALTGQSEPTVATVNIHSHFSPASFALEFSVDATAIGEAFRPEAAQVVVTTKSDMTEMHPSHWPAISQMVFGQEVVGQNVSLTDGLGIGGLAVWNTLPDGKTLYDYGLLLQNLTFAGQQQPYAENDFYTLSYQSPAHFNGAGQSAPLVVLLTPKTYSIRYEPNGGTLYGTHSHEHVWSHETVLETVTPLLAGHRFLGWYTDPELTTPSTGTIAADVAADTVLYAKWEPLDAVHLTATVDHGTQAVDTEAMMQIQLLQRPRGSDDAYQPAEDQTATLDSPYWYDGTADKTFTVANLFAYLPTDQDYDLQVTLSGYSLFSHSVESYTDDSGIVHYDVTVHLVRGTPTITFHANNALANDGEDIFRVYYPTTFALPEDGASFHLDSDGTVPVFYDLPQFGYEDHNDYIFAGWYLADGTAFSFSQVYLFETHVYARWIETGTVTQEEDGKNLPQQWNGIYQGYDLVGIQIRTAEKDDQSHNGQAGSGMRFITVLKHQVWEELCLLSENTPEYGLVLAKRDAIGALADDPDFRLEYKGSNVNGKSTTASHSFVTNLKCSGFADHFSGDQYRLYTGVVTYKSAAAQGEDVLAAAHASQMVVRAYLRYTDANGLLRTYYNNYISQNQVGGGCSASYDMALGLLQDPRS